MHPEVLAVLVLSMCWYMCLSGKKRNVSTRSPCQLADCCHLCIYEYAFICISIKIQDTYICIYKLCCAGSFLLFCTHTAWKPCNFCLYLRVSSTATVHVLNCRLWIHSTSGTEYLRVYQIACLSLSLKRLKLQITACAKDRNTWFWCHILESYLRECVGLLHTVVLKDAHPWEVNSLPPQRV